MTPQSRRWSSAHLEAVLADLQHMFNLDPVTVTVRTLAHAVDRSAGASLREPLDYLERKLPTGS